MTSKTPGRRGYKFSLIFNNYTIMVGLLVMLVAAMLGWMASERFEAFQEHHIAVAHESATGVENQVAFYITEKRRVVELFVADHIEQVRALARAPDNDALRDKLGKSLHRYFPDHFAFSLADLDGTPLFADFDGLVSELCLADIKEFVRREQVYLPYIHPNAEAYHFDIMVRYGVEKYEGVFFVSFTTDTLSNILKSIQSSGHKMILVYEEHSNIIEVVAEGARNRWSRDDYRLFPEELARVNMRHDIPGTHWQAVTIHDKNLFTDYKRKLLVESLVLFLVFATLAITLVIRLRREERQRGLVEEQQKNLMSMVTHEFRSPVSVIKSALDLVADSNPDHIVAENVKEFIDMAMSSTSQLLLLVDDFLDLQKLESGNMQLDKQVAQLSSIVRHAVSNNKLYAENFNAHYQLIEPVDEQFVSCDEQRIYQVISNLLTNAVKYGGDKDTILVAVTETDRRLRVSITDHGPGIAEEFQQKVFEKFAMVYAPKINQKVKSTGLGLSIAKQLIQQHGGEIGFNTEINKGTTFWFELPIVNEDHE